MLKICHNSNFSIVSKNWWTVVLIYQIEYFCFLIIADDELLKNQDFKNYYMLGLMIITGIPIKKLEKINLPTIHKARWYTYAIHLLRLYVQTENPSIELIKSVRFILKFHLCMSICVKICPLVQGNCINVNC